MQIINVYICCDQNLANNFELQINDIVNTTLVKDFIVILYRYIIMKLEFFFN